MKTSPVGLKNSLLGNFERREGLLGFGFITL